ncbi:unnamed protein product, partial [Pleuronectes platessa]
LGRPWRGLLGLDGAEHMLFGVLEAEEIWSYITRPSMFRNRGLASGKLTLDCINAAVRNITGGSADRVSQKSTILM